MTNDVKDEPCAFCGGITDRYAGNPSRWPIWFCHPDGTGVSRPHHQGCVVDRCFRAAQQDGAREAARAALFEPRESDAYDNLWGALIDIERYRELGKPADDVCIRTIKRVMEQIANAKRALEQ